MEMEQSGRCARIERKRQSEHSVGKEEMKRQIFKLSIVKHHFAWTRLPDLNARLLYLVLVVILAMKQLESAARFACKLGGRVFGGLFISH